MDIDDCIAGSVEDFVAKALLMGTDRDFRDHIAGRILERSSTLFDRPDMGIALGAALKQIAQAAR